MKCIALEFTCLINRYFSVLIIGYLAHLASESETTLTLNAYPVNTITAQSTLIQDVTHRSESIIGNLIDKSILLDFTR